MSQDFNCLRRSLFTRNSLAITLRVSEVLCVEGRVSGQGGLFSCRLSDTII